MQTAQCIVAESQRIAHRNCGSIAADKDFNACACPQYRRIAINWTTDTSRTRGHGARCLQRWTSQAAPTPQPASARGTITRLEAGACSPFAGQGGQEPPATSTGTIEWHDDGVKVASDGFTLRTLRGSRPDGGSRRRCQFMVGGGRAAERGRLPRREDPRPARRRCPPSDRAGVSRPRSGLRDVLGGTWWNFASDTQSAVSRPSHVQRLEQWDPRSAPCSGVSPATASAKPG